MLALLAEPAANSSSISRRLEGVLRSPTFTIRKRYAHILASGLGCRLNVRVDNFTMIRDPIYGGLKQSLDNESQHWMTVDLETWKGHRAYFEFDDLTTPDPSDESDKQVQPARLPNSEPRRSLPKSFTAPFSRALAPSFPG